MLIKYMSPQKLAEKYRALIKTRMSLYDIGTAHDEKSHWYTMDGLKYPSVTAKLQILKDEGLMNWKMNRALEYLRNYIMAGSNIDLDSNNIDEFIAEAKLAPQLEFEGAGSIGTQVHDWRERWFSEIIQSTDDMTIDHVLDKDADSAVISGCRGIHKFMEETDYIPVATELRLASHELKLGGSLDDIGILPHPYKVEVDNPVLGKGYKIRYKPKLALIDLKTSNIGDKASYFLQVALYYYMFKRLTGITLQEFYILHVSKVDGTYKLIPIPDIVERIKDAKLVLKLNDSLERIAEAKKKKPIII